MQGAQLSGLYESINSFTLQRYRRRRCLSSLDPSAFHQTIVLTHQQLCFDLLQCIQYNTYHDQQ